LFVPAGLEQAVKEKVCRACTFLAAMVLLRGAVLTVLLTTTRTTTVTKKERTQDKMTTNDVSSIDNKLKFPYRYRSLI